MAKRKNLIVALIINIIIVVFEIIAVVLSVNHHGIKVFRFYTEDSNYFALVISFVFCVSTIFALKSNSKIPKWVHFLRYTSTACLTLTFIIILFVLSPMYKEKFVYWMFTGSGIFHHTLCPLLSFFSFIFFENFYILNKKELFLSLLPTIVYGVTCIILNLTHALIGPYPFFYVYALPWYISTVSLMGVLFCTVLISITLYKVNNKKSKAQN